MMNTAHPTPPQLKAPILPVVVVNSVTHALRIAEGLIEGGIEQIAITLRTPCALDAIAAVKQHFPELLLSAGTVLTPKQFDQAHAAGASFCISPGLTNTLAEYALHQQLMWIPGFATASEMLLAIEMNFTTLKFFPAMTNGGPAALAALASTVTNVQFIPTGGIELNDLAHWKKIPSVIACGGTWLSKNLDDNSALTKQIAIRAKTTLDAWSQA